MTGTTTHGLVCAHPPLYSTLARGMPAPPATPTDFTGILEQVWWRLDAALDLDLVRWSALLGAVEALEAGGTEAPWQPPDRDRERIVARYRRGRDAVDRVGDRPADAELADRATLVRAREVEDQVRVQREPGAQHHAVGVADPGHLEPVARHVGVDDHRRQGRQGVAELHLRRVFPAVERVGDELEIAGG